MLSPLLLLVELRGRCATRGRAWNSTTPPRYGETDSLRIQTQPAFYAPLQMSSRAVDGAVACTQDREKAGNPRELWLYKDGICSYLEVSFNCPLLDDFVARDYEVVDERKFQGAIVRLLRRKAQ